jgi:hypothetical protein
MCASRVVFLLFCFLAVPCIVPSLRDTAADDPTLSFFSSALTWSRVMMLGADAQACVPFRGSPGTAHKCDAFLQGSNVFISPGATYESVDATAGSFTRLFGAYVPPACRTAGLRLLCLSYFLSCSFSDAGLAGASSSPFDRELLLQRG